MSSLLSLLNPEQLAQDVEPNRFSIKVVSQLTCLCWMKVITEYKFLQKKKKNNRVSERIDSVSSQYQLTEKVEQVSCQLEIVVLSHS